MRKTLITLVIIYAFLSIVGVVFLFNNFTISAETNFIFRIVAVSLFCFIASFPLVIATSINICPPVWAKILLYISYVILASSSLFFAFKTFGDNGFMYNINLTTEAFKNSQRNLTSPLWICLLLSLICLIPVLSVKMGKGWPDWTFILFVPFSLVIVGILVSVLGILIVYWIIKGLAGSSSDSYSSSASSSYSSDYSDSSDDDTNESETAESSRHGYLRASGERFYDGKGYLRDPGERFYDSQGYLRDPGERFYDGKGILRDPGERYYDSEGILRDPGENYYDGGN